MPGARVHRLRLFASHDDDVRRGAILIGDALRVATLPEARSARHYVVRHLHVGRFARDASPQTIALAIERRLAAVTPLAVSATSTGAVAAPAVWFDDEATAIAMLAERVAAGPPPTEWFWRQIAGGALRGPTTSAVLEACLGAAASLEGGARAVAHLVDRVEHARPGALLSSLTTAHAHALSRTLFSAAPPPPPPSPGAPPVSFVQLARLAPMWRARLLSWVPRWPTDVRSTLLAALALVDAGAAPPSHDRLLAQALQLATALVASTGTPDATPPRAPVPVTPASDPRPPSSAGPPPLSDFRPPSPTPSAAHAAAPPDSPSRSPSPSADTPPPPTTSSTPFSPITDGDTSLGGLLFLLRPLAHLDLPGWIDRHAWAASSAFAARLLAGIALDHGAAPDDPLVVALTADIADAAVDRALDRPLVRRAWTRTLDRWLRRNTDLSVATIVRRPARVAATRTHLDVVFRLRDADIAIRLAALDADPGWVPWLGRVVRFHYTSGSPR